MGAHESVARYLKKRICRFCPGISVKYRSWQRLARSDHFLSIDDYDYRATREALQTDLRRSIREPENDPDGLFAERRFSRDAVVLRDVDLLTTTVSALVSPPKTPPLFLTYSNLCHDPLVLFQSPLSVWQRTGLRRVILYVLHQLLDINSSVPHEVGVVGSTGGEMHAARNAIFVRTLVNATSTSAGGSFEPCPMTTSTVRRLIAKNRGVLTVLLTQGLGDDAMGWLFNNVPECFEDGIELVSVLSNPQSALSAAETGILLFARKRPTKLQTPTMRTLHLLIDYKLTPLGVPWKSPGNIRK